MPNARAGSKHGSDWLDVLDTDQLAGELWAEYVRLYFSPVPVEEIHAAYAKVRARVIEVIEARRVA